MTGIRSQTSHRNRPVVCLGILFLVAKALSNMRIFDESWTIAPYNIIGGHQQFLMNLKENLSYLEI